MGIICTAAPTEDGEFDYEGEVKKRQDLDLEGGGKVHENDDKVHYVHYDIRS